MAPADSTMPMGNALMLNNTFDSLAHLVADGQVDSHDNEQHMSLSSPNDPVMSIAGFHGHHLTNLPNGVKYDRLAESDQCVREGESVSSAPCPNSLQPQLDAMMQSVLQAHRCDHGIVSPVSMHNGKEQHILKSISDNRTSKTQSRSSRRSRDPKSRPLSLAATHPANYTLKAQESTITLPVTPMGYPKQVLQQPTPSPSVATSPAAASPRSSSPEPPWRQYTDPMWQTSTDPNIWYNNFTILKCDRSVDVGNVTSPTCMIGLPCGGMIELAYYYPHEEEFERR